MNRERFDELLDLAARGCLDEAADAEFQHALASNPDLRAEAHADRRLVSMLGRAGQIARATRRAPAGLLAGAIAAAKAEAEVETGPLPAVAKVIDVTPAARTAGGRRGLPWMWIAAGLVVAAGTSFLAFQATTSTMGGDFASAKMSASKPMSLAMAAPADAPAQADKALPALVSSDAVWDFAAANEHTLERERDIGVVEIDGDGDLDMLVAELLPPSPAAVEPDSTPPGAGEMDRLIAAVATPAAPELQKAEVFYGTGNAMPSDDEVAVASSAATTSAATTVEEPAAAQPATELAMLVPEADGRVDAFADTESPAPPPTPMANGAGAYADGSRVSPDGVAMMAVPASSGAVVARPSGRPTAVDTPRPDHALAGASVASAAIPAPASVVDARAIAEVASRPIPPDEVAFLISNAVANGAVLRSARVAPAPAEASMMMARPSLASEPSLAQERADAARVASTVGGKQKAGAPLDELTLDFPSQAQYQAFRWRVENASMTSGGASYRALNDQMMAGKPAADSARAPKNAAAPSAKESALYQQSPGGELRGSRSQPPASLGISGFAPSPGPVGRPAAVPRGGGPDRAESSPAARRVVQVPANLNAPVLGNRFATQVQSSPSASRVRVTIRALAGTEGDAH